MKQVITHESTPPNEFQAELGFKGILLSRSAIAAWLVAAELTDAEALTIMAGSTDVFSGLEAIGFPVVDDSLPVPPAWTTIPSITGTTMQGSTLTGVDGVVEGGTITGRQWRRNGNNISGATTNTYVLGIPDVGTQITYRQTATNEAGSVSSVSNPTATIAAIPAPVFTVIPSITGSATVGQTLTGSDGTISGGTVSVRQWQRNGTNISGATSSTYEVTEDDLDTTLVFKVTATGAGGTTVGYSNPTNEVGTSTPTITSSDGEPASLIDNEDGTFDVVIDGDTVGTVTQTQINEGGWITVVEPVVGMSGNNVVLTASGYIIYVGDAFIETDVEVFVGPTLTASALPYDASAHSGYELSVRFSFSIGSDELVIDKVARESTLWYETTAKFAWDSVADNNPAEMNPIIGNTLALTGTPATIAAGLWDAGAAGRYTSDTGLPSALSGNHPILIAAVMDKDNHATDYVQIMQFGFGNFCGFYVSGSGVMRGRWVAGGTSEIACAPATRTGKHVYWTFYDADPVNPKVHSGIDLVENGTGTSRSSMAGQVFTERVYIFGTSVNSSQVKHGSIQVLNEPGLTVASILAGPITKMMGLHGI